MLGGRPRFVLIFRVFGLLMVGWEGFSVVVAMVVLWLLWLLLLLLLLNKLCRAALFDIELPLKLLLFFNELLWLWLLLPIAKFWKWLIFWETRRLLSIFSLLLWYKDNGVLVEEECPELFVDLIELVWLLPGPIPEEELGILILMLQVFGLIWISEELLILVLVLYPLFDEINWIVL